MMRSSTLFLLSLTGFAVGVRLTSLASSFSCVPGPLFNASLSVTYQPLNCSGSYTNHFGQKKPVGPLVFHVAVIDLALVDSGASRVVPVVANSSVPYSLQSVSEMAPANGVVGINGGYFWRLDSKSFLDDVCWGKSRADAQKSVQGSCRHPNYGVGDGLVVIDGEILSCNCDLVGNSVPALLALNGSSTHIKVQRRGEGPPQGLLNGIAAGPNLITAGKIDIEGLNVNIIEHSSNTAAGLRGRRADGGFAELVLVVADGHDGCKASDPTCGISALPMAHFMLEVIGSEDALEFDQGGSSTMWVKGLGVVSNPGSGERNIYSGLFATE